MHTYKQLILVLMALLLAPSLDSQAQSGGGFEIRRSTIDGGGGRSTASTFALTGTAGQADASFSSGGNFEVRGGFWAGASASSSGGNDNLFNNGFE